MAKTVRQYQQEIEDLRARLQEAEETLEAIRSGAVDAIVVAQGDQQQVFTLHGAETAYRTILEEMNEGAAMLAADGSILYCNACLAEVLGKPLEQVLGGPMEPYVLPEDRMLFQSLLQQAAVDGSRGEMRLRRDDGTTVPVYLSMNPLSLDQAASVCMVATDLSEQKRHEQVLAAEQQLKDLNETLEKRVAERTAEANHRAEQLRALAAQLTQAEQRERQRLAEILHDHLQQLLVGTKFHLGMLRAERKEHGLRQSLDQIDSLLDQSLETSRNLTVDLSPPILVHGNMSQVLRWLADWMRSKHGLHVTLTVDEQSDPEAQEVRVLLFQAVRELLFNVVKHAKVTEAAVDLRRLDDQHIQLTVSDKGAGFDMAQAPKGSNGSGFGLFTIRERLDWLNGSFRIDSRPGEGACAVLVAPVMLSLPVPNRFIAMLRFDEDLKG